MPNNREELIQVVTTSIDNALMMVPDCYTFIFSRGQYNADREANNCGGGNFLMALGLFTVIGHLASLYWILSGKEYNRPSNVDASERNDVSTEIAFCKLIKDLPTSFNVGITASDSGKIWKYFRNKLAHLGIPAQAVRTFLPQQPTNNFLELVRTDTRPVFVWGNNHWICEVDILAFRTEEIGLWLRSKLETSEFSDDNAARAFSWIVKSLEQSE